MIPWPIANLVRIWSQLADILLRSCSITWAAGAVLSGAIAFNWCTGRAEPLTSPDVGTLNGKVIVGYQGWFGCPGDQAGTPVWRHWLNPGGSLAVDMLPDASELPKSELCEAPFLRHADGSPVFLFSSRNRETVQRHFEWLRQYAIDGVALQRFLSGLNDDHLRIEMDQVLQNVQSSAETNHRVFFVMYDISGSTKDDWLQLLQQDWRRLVEDLNVTRSNSYLHHNGRPVVGIWGLGFADRPASPASALSGLDFFSQAAPAHLQASIVGGVPTHWRQQANQAPDGHSWREVYSRLDVISPWLIYAFTSDVEGARFASTVMRQDIRFTAALGKTYMPVVFPGFSNRNLRDGQTRLNAIPRKCGAFMKAQMLNAINEGAKALYIAMFDELNEGTAIMKIEPRTLDNPRLDLVASDQDGCTEPNDLYLRIAEAARLISARN